MIFSKNANSSKPQRYAPILTVGLPSSHNKSSSHIFIEVVENIVINTVPFRSERMEFFVPVCKPVPETPSFHLGPDFGVFRPVSTVPTNSGQFRPVWKFRPVRDSKLKKKKKTVTSKQHHFGLD